MPYRKLPSSTGYILCYSVSGTVTSEDYRNLLIPDVEQAFNEFGKVRILIDISDFSVKDMQWAAMWQDAKFGLKIGKIEKFAVICHHRGIAYMLRAFLLGATYRSFSADDKESAFEWIFDGSAFILPELAEEEKASNLESPFGSIPFVHTSKFLVALDSAEPARCALAQAIHLLRGEGNEELHLMTVITNGKNEDTLKRTISEARKLVNDYYERNDSSNKLLTFEHIVNNEQEKSIAKTILEVAEEVRADYIIIGTQKVENKNTMNDSVCLEVIQKSKVPVLVCKAGQDTPSEKLKSRMKENREKKNQLLDDQLRKIEQQKNEAKQKKEEIENEQKIAEEKRLQAERLQKEALEKDKKFLDKQKEKHQTIFKRKKEAINDEKQLENKKKQFEKEENQYSEKLKEAETIQKSLNDENQKFQKVNTNTENEFDEKKKQKTENPQLDENMLKF
jgi:nucleotide-binding universal stress UspA family protein